MKLPVINPSESAFPSLERRWLQSLCDMGGAVQPLPVEIRSTCDDCAMWAKPDRDQTELDVAFDPDTKCCTTIVTIDNFRAGMILATDGQAEAQGRNILEQRIANRVGVTPIAIAASTKEQAADAQMRAAARFGCSKAHRCPYYLDDGPYPGGCAIWQHRPTTCSTFYCRFTRGAVGAELWRTLQNTLRTAERALARWCLLQLDFRADALAVLFPAKPAALPCTTGATRDASNDQVYDQVWGNWLGREQEFFGACAEQVAPLSWQDVLDIAGPELGLLAKMTQRALAKFHDEAIGPHLQRASFDSVGVGLTDVRVRAYSTLDTVDFPMQVIAALQLFDGRPVAEVLPDAEQRFGTTIDSSLLRELVDFGLLVEKPA